MRHALLTLDDAPVIACNPFSIHHAALTGRRLSLRQWEWLHVTENRAQAWDDWASRAELHEVTRAAEEAGLIAFSPSQRMAQVKAEHKLREEWRVLTWLDDMARHVYAVADTLARTRNCIVLRVPFGRLLDRLNDLRAMPIPPELQACSVTAVALREAIVEEQAAA